jgi:hypothetical protein
MKKRKKKASRCFAGSAKSVGLARSSGTCAITKWRTPCYQKDGKPNGKHLEPGMCFEVSRCVQIKRLIFAFIKVDGKTEVISVGDIFTG